MAKVPTAPCFVHTPGKDDLWLRDEPAEVQKVSSYSLSTGRLDDCLFFDADGKVWRVIVPIQSRYKKWYWRVFSLFYSPVFYTPVNWQFVRNYDLAELLSVLREQVSSDDDVLTQFYDPGEVYPLLDGARDFADVLAIWSKLERGPNEEQP